MAFTGFVFYSIGNLSRTKSIIPLKFNSFIFSIVALTYTLVFSFLNNGEKFIVDMNSGTYGNIFFFYLAALAGVSLTVVIAKWVASSEIMGYLGRNSLVIFILNILPIRIFKNQLGIGLNVSLSESLICTVGEIALLIPLIYVINFVKSEGLVKLKNQTNY